MTHQRLVVLVTLFAAAGCVPNKMYRQTSVLHEQLATRQFEPTEVNDDSAWRYRLAFIEFDDRGEMFQRAQLTRAVEEVARAKADAQAGSGMSVVALFVHGWKNNASEGSGNVWGFRQVLAGLSKQFNSAEEPERVPVVGVYVGWRGAVLSPPVLKEFTFFDRHRKSQNLQGAHLVEALIKVLQAAKGADYDDGSTRAVLIGHSFGGAVLETSLTQTLVGLAVRAKSAGQPMRWPADVIMFVNEAQEAIQSYQLIEAFKENLPPRDPPLPGDESLERPNGCLPPPAAAQTARQRERPPAAPAIVSISSTGDYATRVAFKAAKSLQRPFNSLRTYDKDAPNFLGLERQTPMFLNTTAHLREFHSHLMGRCRCEQPAAEGGCDPQNLRCEDPALEAARQACKVNIQATLGSAIYAIVEKPGARNRTPYWVLQMPPTIVSDHSTIFTPVFRNFVITLLLRSMAGEPGPQG
jgi:hypothetical protein